MHHKSALRFALIKGSPVPELEKFIAQNPETAYLYASEILKNSFPEGEKTISKNPKYACIYAMYVISGRWEKGEDAIAKDPEHAYLYARNIIKGRWKKGENAIANDPEYAYFYALYVIKGRWKKGEKTIAKHPEYACLYAVFIIKGRWKEGEKAIAENSYYSYLYAYRAINQRFELGEKAIAKDPKSLINYLVNVSDKMLTPCLITELMNNKKFVLPKNKFKILSSFKINLSKDFKNFVFSMRLMNFNEFSVIIPRLETLTPDLIVFSQEYDKKEKDLIQHFVMALNKTIYNKTTIDLCLKINVNITKSPICKVSYYVEPFY